MTMREYLHSLSKQGYLDCVQVSISGGPAPSASQAPRRKSRTDDDNEATNEWRWGSRAHAEISEHSVAEFVVEFMRERFIKERLADEEEERERGALSPKIKEEADKYARNILRDIARAAGGALTKAVETT
jgi:melanoma-associated antigen